MHGLETFKSFLYWIDQLLLNTDDHFFTHNMCFAHVVSEASLNPLSPHSAIKHH